MWADKTDQPCDCSWLQHHADDPDIPVEFDSRLNEYHFVYGPADRRGRLLIHHCPFCGGRAPESKRVSLFATISQKEQSRLVALTKTLKTVDAVIEALGAPDRDDDAGVVSTMPEKNGKPPETWFIRTLLYKGLSDTADIHVNVGPTDKVSISFRGKYIGGADAS